MPDKLVEMLRQRTAEVRENPKEAARFWAACHMGNIEPLLRRAAERGQDFCMVGPRELAGEGVPPSLLDVPLGGWEQVAALAIADWGVKAEVRGSQMLGLGVMISWKKE